MRGESDRDRAPGYRDAGRLASNQCRLRVGILCPYSLTAPGGVQKHVLSLAAALAGEGVDAEVLAPADGPVPPAHVPTISLGHSVPVPANGSIARIGLDPVGVARLWRARDSYDVLHVHEPLVPGIALAAALQRKVPTVGTFHAASDGGYWPYRAFGGVLGVAWRRLHVRTAVSEAAAERVRPYFLGDIEIIPNGFECGRFAGAEPLTEHEAGERPIVLFVGRDEPRKGLGVLREAFGRIREIVPGATLWLVGPGTEKIRGASIRAFGAVDDDMLASLYATADVFCAPARFGESFGVVLLEAMAAGTAVVATSIPGYAAVARHGQEAVLVPPGNPDRLADALASVCTDTALRHRLASAGRERAWEFDWSRLAGRVADVYRRARKTRPRS